MIHWLLLALTAPLLFAAVNHIDKHLISKYFQDAEIGSLAIFSSLAGLPVVILIAAFQPHIFQIPPNQASLLILNGSLFILATISYFYALAQDETTIVTPLFQMIPIITFILAYLFLHESITFIQLLGSLLIAFASVGLSLDISSPLHKFKFKTKIFSLMLLSSMLFALNGFIFKLVAVNKNFWATTFWEYTGFVAIAILLLIFHHNYRLQFIQVLKQNKASLLGLNLTNETLAITGKTIIHYATTLAPLSLVFWVSEGFQPLFVLLLGILITKLWPSLGQENLITRHLTHKLLAITVMLAGTYLISQ